MCVKSKKRYSKKEIDRSLSWGKKIWELLDLRISKMRKRQQKAAIRENKDWIEATEGYGISKEER